MDIDFRAVRRQNRVLDDKARIDELLATAEYGFLSLGNDENGYGYGIPISYAYDCESENLYFHCAPDGKKMDLLSNNSNVSFCVVGVTRPIGEQFATLYESVIAFGEADSHLSDDEKRKALRLLIRKYSNGYEELGEKYIDKSWSRTAAFKIRIKHITAKAKYK